jgi:hypothetical protein
MRGAVPPLPNTPLWRGAQLKHRDTFETRYLTVGAGVTQYSDKATICAAGVRFTVRARIFVFAAICSPT